MAGNRRLEKELIRGWLHEPDGSPRAAVTLFHGAGGNCEAPLMVAVAEAFRKEGYLVFRGDLPFRQDRARGSPTRNSERDREGIRRAGVEIRKLAGGIPLCLAGHSYGGRQCTMLAAEDPSTADALLLLSYPLHAPGNAKQRTEHFPNLRSPALFVHGTRDTFGTIEEMEAALKLIPARKKLIPIEGGKHGLPPSVAASLPGWLSGIMD